MRILKPLNPAWYDIFNFTSHFAFVHVVTHIRTTLSDFLKSVKQAFSKIRQLEASTIP